MNAIAARRPARTRSTSSGLVESPTRSRCSPRAHNSPGFVRGERVASSRAASRSKLSGRSAFSRVSRLRSRSRISSSPKPDRVRSISGLDWRSARRRARRASSQEPEILLRARFRRRACSTDRSSQMTGTEVSPSRRAAIRRWWPPMTVLSSFLARTGWTKPNWRRLRVSDSSSSSPMRRGLAGSGCSWSIGTCSTVIGIVVIGRISSVSLLGCLRACRVRLPQRVAALRSTPNPSFLAPE